MNRSRRRERCATAPRRRGLASPCLPRPWSRSPRSISGWSATTCGTSGRCGSTVADRRPGLHRRIRRGAAAHDDDVACAGVCQRHSALVDFTPLRKQQPIWIRLATYSAWVGTVGHPWRGDRRVAYSPAKKYLYAGQPSRIPYRGQKRWHTRSGWSSAWRPSRGPSAARWRSGRFLRRRRRAPPPRHLRRRRPERRPRAADAGRWRWPCGGIARPRRHVGFRGTSTKPHRAARRPADQGSGVLVVRGNAAQRRPPRRRPAWRFSLDGEPIDSFDEAKVLDLVRRSVPIRWRQTRLIDEYDYDDVDRTWQRPLPVILARTHDEADPPRHRSQDRHGRRDVQRP